MMKMINILSVAFSITLLVRGCDTEQNAVVCGSAKLNTRVGGNSSLVSPGVWPWMASLQFNGSHVCGGTLIAERFVMSSASCFTRSTNASHWTVILGRLNQNGSDSTEVSTKVVNITLSSGTGENVAVLQLAVAPKLTNFIQPICVDMGDNTFSTNTQCWAAGWGSGAGVSQTLQEFQTSIVSCGNSSSNNSICTSSLNLQEGDQGGPLMCKLGQSWIHAAVLTLQSSIQTSISSSSSSSNTRSSNSTLASRSARAQDVQVFTKTSSFASFLTSVVGSFPAKATNSTSSTTSAAANKPPQAASSGAQASSSFCFTVSVLLLALTALKIFQGIN